MSHLLLAISALFFFLTVWVLFAHHDHTVTEHLVIDNPDDLTQHDLVVVSAHYNEDVEWLKRSDKPVVICSKVKESPLCQVEVNKGREVSAYIKFIIENYDRLPYHIAFLHGHETSWHQQVRLGLLELIYKGTEYRKYDFISLNDKYIDDRNPTNRNFQLLLDVWSEHFAPYLGDRPAPTRLLHDCCAQFVVSRKMIRRISLETWKYWYGLCLKPPNNISDYDMGIIFEFLWPVIFGEPDIVLQEEHRKRYKPWVMPRLRSE